MPPEIKVVGPRKVDYSWAFPLVPIQFRVLGCYGNPGTWLPARMRYLHPAAVGDFARLQADTGCNLVYSDMYRTFAESLNARRRKGAGLVAFPGNSGHNWGVSFDIDVERSVAVLESAGKIPAGLGAARRMLAFYDFMGQYGFSPMASVRAAFEGGKRYVSEQWHLNHSTIGDMSVAEWAGEQLPDELSLSTREIKSCLNELGYDVWPIDDNLDDATRSRVARFQKDYDLTADGIPGPKTQRTLACFCGDIEEVESPFDLSSLELVWG